MRCHEVSGECPEKQSEYHIQQKSRVHICLKSFWICGLRGIMDLATVACTGSVSGDITRPLFYCRRSIADKNGRSVASRAEKWKLDGRMVLTLSGIAEDKRAQRQPLPEANTHLGQEHRKQRCSDVAHFVLFSPPSGNTDPS